MRSTNRRWMGALGAVLALAIVVGGRAVRADDDTVRAGVQAQYDKIAEAYKTQDLAQAVEVRLGAETADFTNKEKDKTYTREEYDAMAREGLKKLQQVAFTVKDYTNTIDALEVEGDKAGVVTTTVIKCTIKGEDGADVPATITTQTKNIWVKAGDDWKLQYLETLPRPAKE